MIYLVHIPEEVETDTWYEIGKFLSERSYTIHYNRLCNMYEYAMDEIDATFFKISFPSLKITPFIIDSDLYSSNKNYQQFVREVNSFIEKAT